MFGFELWSDIIESDVDSLFEEESGGGEEQLQSFSSWKRRVADLFCKIAIHLGQIRWLDRRTTRTCNRFIASSI